MEGDCEGGVCVHDQMGRSFFFFLFFCLGEKNNAMDVVRKCQLLWDMQKNEKERTDRILRVFVAIGLESEG